MNGNQHNRKMTATALSVAAAMSFLMVSGAGAKGIESSGGAAKATTLSASTTTLSGSKNFGLE